MPDTIPARALSLAGRSMTSDTLRLWCLRSATGLLVLFMLVGVLLSVKGCTEPAYAHETWRGLVVAPEDKCTPYEEEDYRYPQSLKQKLWLAIGAPYSPYTDMTYGSLADLDIEHVTSRHQAHVSGLCKASQAVRYAFVTDMLNLTFAPPRLNRAEKRARDASGWLPDHNRFWFVTRIVLVKSKYALSVDPAERDALEAVLSAAQHVSLRDVPPRLASADSTDASLRYSEQFADTRSTHPACRQGTNQPDAAGVQCCASLSFGAHHITSVVGNRAGDQVQHVDAFGVMADMPTNFLRPWFELAPEFQFKDKGGEFFYSSSCSHTGVSLCVFGRTANLAPIGVDADSVRRKPCRPMLLANKWQQSACPQPHVTGVAVTALPPAAFRPLPLTSLAFTDWIHNSAPSTAPVGKEWGGPCNAAPQGAET